MTPGDDPVLRFFGESATIAPELVAEHRIVVLYAGDVLAGGIEVVEQLGLGGMGAVCEVRALRLNAHRALKVRLPSLLASPPTQARFLEEIKVCQRLSHESIVRVHDVLRGRGTGHPFGETGPAGRPLLDRGDLYQMLKGVVPAAMAPRPSEEALDVPRALDGIVARCLKRKPQDRYESVVALGKVLDEVVVVQASSLRRAAG